MAGLNYDVLRDEAGQPVTLSLLQLKAIWHAVEVWRQVCQDEGRDIDFREPNLAKSRLLGRMLIDGRPPLAEAPPDYMSAPGYHLVEPELKHYYLDASPQLVILESPVNSTEP